MYLLKGICAKGGTRTPTPLRALDPKSSASTNFATLAFTNRATYKAIRRYEFLRSIYFVLLLNNTICASHIILPTI